MKYSYAKDLEVLEDFLSELTDDQLISLAENDFSREDIQSAIIHEITLRFKVYNNQKNKANTEESTAEIFSITPSSTDGYMSTYEKEEYSQDD